MNSENNHLFESRRRLRLADRFSKEFGTQQQHGKQQRCTTLDINNRIDGANAGFNRQRK